MSSTQASTQAPSGATRPAILTVDDDLDVLHAVERDLRRHYSGEYRVVSADSGPAAPDVLRELKRREVPVAIVVADQRMPGMTGVELLYETRELFPDVKTVLLTAYADTDAAIAAINRVRLDYYVLKPWDPPEQTLYPVLDDLLGDWHAGFHPNFDGVRVLGHRWSSDGHRLRDFLARNLVPFQWLDVETDEDAKRLLTASGDGALKLPAVVLSDGSVGIPSSQGSLRRGPLVSTAIGVPRLNACGDAPVEGHEKVATRMAVVGLDVPQPPGGGAHAWAVVVLDPARATAER